MLHGKTTPHRGRDRGIDVQISVPSTDLAALRWEVAMIAFWLKGSVTREKRQRELESKTRRLELPQLSLCSLFISHELKEIMLGSPVP